MLTETNAPKSARSLQTGGISISMSYGDRHHVDLVSPPRQLQQDGRALQRRSVGWPAMHSGPQTAQPWQLQSRLTNDGPMRNFADIQQLDKRRSTQHKEVVKFATTRCALPPTPPSSATSFSSSSSGSSAILTGSRDHARRIMDPALQRQDAARVLPSDNKLDSTTLSKDGLKQSRKRPFQQRHGRRYTRDLSYPLPCDVAELQRQNLRTSLACTVFGRPICSTDARGRPPARVLELGCGTAYWSASCHKTYAASGYGTIQFTGMDIVPVAPDLQRQGLNWKFVQHDMKRVPWPFDDGSFDFIMWKDLSLVANVGVQSQRILDECIRVLRVGGTLEIWEYDNLIRCVQPHTVQACRSSEDEKTASVTATCPITSGTPFAPSRNRYLKAANKWIDSAVAKRNLASTPCARMATMLLQEPEHLGKLGIRRVAIPLSSLSPGQEAATLRCKDNRRKSQIRPLDSKLKRDQLVLRQTALLTVIQMIESLEPLLKETSGKNNEEWSFWWASMMANVSSDEKKSLNGECLEIGAWWATKLDNRVV